MPIHDCAFDKVTLSNPVDTEFDIEELALEATSAKFKAGIAFRFEAFKKLVSLGYDTESAHAIARNLWDEA